VAFSTAVWTFRQWRYSCLVFGFGSASTFTNHSNLFSPPPIFIFIFVLVVMTNYFVIVLVVMTDYFWIEKKNNCTNLSKFPYWVAEWIILASHITNLLKTDPPDWDMDWIYVYMLGRLRYGLCGFFFYESSGPFMNILPSYWIIAGRCVFGRMFIFL